MFDHLLLRSRVVATFHSVAGSGLAPTEVVVVMAPRGQETSDPGEPALHF